MFVSKRKKVSKFNEYLGKIDRQWIVYNNLSGAMVEVNQEICRALENNQLDILDNPNLINSLLKGRFLVDPGIDEIELIKNKKNKYVHDGAVLGLQILPTLRCNFNCTYCYQGNEKKDESTITPEVTNALIDYLKEKIKPTTRYLNLSWYGGEPLLAMDKIVEITHKITKLTEPKDISYFAGIVTNGYLLTERNISLLKELNIKSCQVTIDGPREIHDQRRMLIDGSGTWDIIIENVKNTLAAGIEVTLRINIDQTNIKEINKFLNYLGNQAIFDKVDVTFGLVSSFGNACKSIEHNLLSKNKANDIVNQKEFKKFLNRTKKTKGRLIPDYIGCVATAGNSIILCPGGEVYKCSKTIGMKEEQGGTILNLYSNHRNIKKWTDYSNLGIPKCRECSMLPICGGPGCAHSIIIAEEKVDSCNREFVHEQYRQKLRDMYRSKKTQIK